MIHIVGHNVAVSRAISTREGALDGGGGDVTKGVTVTRLSLG